MKKRRKHPKRTSLEIAKTEVQVQPKPNYNFIGRFSGIVGIFLGKFTKALFTDD